MSGNDERPSKKKLFGIEKYEVDEEEILRILTEVPVPPELIRAKMWLEYRKRMAVSPELKRAIDVLIREMNMRLDCFRRTPEIVREFGETGE